MKLLCSLLATLPVSVVAAPRADLSADLAKILAGSDQVPALAAAVVVKDQIVAAGAGGIRKLGEPAKVTIEDKFHLGSNTKAMTATLAAILVREKKIKWNTTLEESLSKVRIHEGFKGATLEQLLSNTGGCPGDFSENEWSRLVSLRGAPPRHRTELAKLVLRNKPAYPPGTGYEYSNAGFALAGAMLEYSTGESYEDLLRRHLFEPLKMSSAGFRAPATNRKVDHPYGHLVQGRTTKLKPIDPEPQGDNPNAIAPAGLAHCSIIDYAKYARAHLGHGPRGFLTQAELEFLHRSRDREESYALGWRVANDQPWAKGPALTHTGSNTMWFSVIWLAPDIDFAVVTACNSGADEGFNKCNEAVSHLVRRYLPQ